jgi:glycosyltransferase involved in cell wall biosynthesis
MLYVDCRYVGKHGIARFSGEVIARLRVEFRELPLQGKPGPSDVVRFRGLGLRPDDVVYSPGYITGLTPARTVLTLHDLIHIEDPVERSGLKALYYERVVRPASRRSGLVLTVSDLSRTAIQRWLGTPDVRVVNVGNGVSPEFMRSQPIEQVVPGTFVYVGNLRPHKNFPVLLQALRLRPRYRMHIVCPDPAEAYQLTMAAGVEQQTEVHHAVPDRALAELYARSCAVLMPSVSEGFGLPVAEAMCSGRRAVYWEGCGPVAQIADDQGIAVASPCDAALWAEAMDLAATSACQPVRLTPEWRSRYDWDDVARRVTDELGRLTAAVGSGSLP